MKNFFNFVFEFSEESIPVKCAAVFPVYRNRNTKAAITESWELEKQLEAAAGYGLWLREGRESLETPPSSTTLRDILGFSTWFNERKRRRDIDGVFVMIM